jgi:hypothetical protein
MATRKRQLASKWAKDGRITETGVRQMIFDVRDGVAHPDDARAVLAEFVRQDSQDRGISRPLLNYLGTAFESYLSGRRSIDQALGLARSKPGKPSAVTEDRAISIAAEVLRELIKGRNLETAAINAGKRMAIGSSQARAYWAAHKQMAVLKLRRERSSTRKPWTTVEAARLERLLKKDGEKLRRLLKAEQSAD